jgi:hypothetical protein
MKTLILVAFVALALNAQAPEKPAAPPAVAPKAQDKALAPKIPDAHRASWWRAYAELRDAQAVLKEKQRIATEARAVLEADCGDGSVLSGDPAGEPACELKPAKKTP